jgi:hypothetical protein
MAKTKLSSAKYVERGYGQVEPNHLSAQRNGQIYAQLPAAADIVVLENGQFVKYDYANNVTNFTGAGEWMLVFNEVKVYRDYETNADFAMKKENYTGKVYSPSGTVANTYASRDYSGITTPASPYEVDSTDAPFQNLITYHETMMPDGTVMVPRVLKTMIGDIYTTNCVNEEALEVNDELVVGDDGYLTKTAGENAGSMKWQVVKVYTLADRQKAVKIMRIA